MEINTKPKSLQNEKQDKRMWFVLRDLKRVNAKVHAYQMLKSKGFKVFTPLRWGSETLADKRIITERPVMPDLLIVYSTEKELIPFINDKNKLQFRFVRGGVKKKMIVNDAEMKRFMQAASEASSIDYYKPEDFNANRIGEKITIHGGQFDGEEGILLRVECGATKKSLVVRLANLFVAVIEIQGSSNCE